MSKQTIKVYRPIKTNYLTQNFGESKACLMVDVYKNPRVRADGSYIIVGKKGNSCPQGYTDFYDWLGYKGHPGYDRLLWHGEPMYFPVEAKAKDGTDVRWYGRSEVDSAGGLGTDIFAYDRTYFEKPPTPMGGLELIKDEWEKNEGWIRPKFRFWHQLSTPITGTFKDSKGEFQWVKTGDFIGRGDSSGASSSDHDHDSMKIVSPDAPAAFTLDADNGYAGAIPYMDIPGVYENYFIGDVMKVKKQAIDAISLARMTITQVEAFIRRNLST